MIEVTAPTIEASDGAYKLDTSLFSKVLFEAGIDPKLSIKQNEHAKTCRFLINGNFVILSVYNYFEHNRHEPYVLIEFEIKSCSIESLTNEVFELTKALHFVPLPLKVSFIECEDSADACIIFLTYRNKLSLTSQAQIDEIINFCYKFGFNDKADLN